MRRRFGVRLVAGVVVCGPVVVCALLWFVGIASAGGATGVTGATGTTTCKPPTGAGATGLAPKPTGLIAYDIYNPTQGTEPFAPAVYNDRSISGVDLAIGWQYLEPDIPGSNPPVAAPIDLNVINCVFQAAARANPPKFVVLTPEPGFHTPSWALIDVPSFTSTFAYHGFSQVESLPEPWDETYLDEWFAFLKTLSRQYADVPAFRMIAAAGPTSVSGEMSLPDLPGGASCVNNPDPSYTVCDKGLPAAYNTPGPGGVSIAIDDSDIKIFQELGYTPAKIVGAWTSVFATYAADFPDQYISLALWQGLPIGSDSQSDPSQVAAIPLEIIQAGLKYRSQFVVQANGLGPRSGKGPPGAFVEANCATVVTGFQTKSPKQEQASDMAGALKAAERAGVDFVELYADGDILASAATTPPPYPGINPVTKGVLAKTAKLGKLPATAACASNDPLTLTAPATAVAGTPLTLVATSHLTNLAYSADGDDLVAHITISDGSTVVGTCPAREAAACTVTVKAPFGATTYDAELSYGDQVPIVSATAQVTGLTKPTTPRPPPASGGSTTTTPRKLS